MDGDVDDTHTHTHAHEAPQLLFTCVMIGACMSVCVCRMIHPWRERGGEGGGGGVKLAQIGVT